MSAEEKEELEKEAKLAADVDLESMAPDDIEKCIGHSMQRVMKEVIFMSTQYFSDLTWVPVHPLCSTNMTRILYVMIKNS